MSEHTYPCVSVFIHYDQPMNIALILPQVSKRGFFFSVNSHHTHMFIVSHFVCVFVVRTVGVRTVRDFHSL